MLVHGHHFLSAKVAVREDRDAKAELNRRSQACEILAGTGISRREKWTEVLSHSHQVRRNYGRRLSPPPALFCHLRGILNPDIRCRGEPSAIHEQFLIITLRHHLLLSVLASPRLPRSGGAASEDWGDQPDSHRYKRRHGA